MKRRTLSALTERAASLAVASLLAVTSAGAATGSTHEFDTVQARAEERPYVVEGSIAYTVILPSAPAAVEPTRDFAALEAAARKKRDQATVQVLGSVVALRLWPLLVVVSNGRAATAPFKLVSEASRNYKDSANLAEQAEQARQTAGCVDALAASAPRAVEKLAEALTSDALLLELRDRVERAAQSRVQSSPVLIAAARGENNAPAEPALAEASRRQVSNLLEIDINEIRVAVDSTGARSAGCLIRVVTDADVRVWSVDNRSVVFADHPPASHGEVVVSVAELAALLDQPRALQARLANQYEDLVLGSLSSAKLRFSAAPSRQ